MYLGGGKIVEARESDTKIMVSDFSSHRNYAGAIRLSGDGGNSGGGTGRHSTWGSGINTRQRPSVSAPLGPVFSGPTRVSISCQEHAESVTAEGVTNDAWSYLPDHQAWISNIFIQGPAWLEDVPACASRRPGDPPNVV